nr:hypothetical protein [Tanacetum cinerariifolium]
MREGTFLGYKVDPGRLRVCLDKVETVLNLPSPKCLKDVQKLNGKLASLNRFLSKLAEKSLPFFKTLNKCTKKSDFQWTAEAEMAFKQMKKLIAELPMLTTPKEKDELIMYLSAGKEAISVVLMMKKDGKQMLIYFVSRALLGPKVNYTPMEKLILALVAGRLLKWRFELEEHDIHYRPRTSFKGHILADFIVECPKDDPLDTPMEDKEELPDPWVLFTDESSCIDGSGAGLIITNLEGMEFTYALRLVDNPANGVYVAKEPGMIKYLEKVKNLASSFEELSMKQVPKRKNKKADTLSKMASTCFAHLSKQVLVEELKEKSIEEILPEEKRKARAIRRKAGEIISDNEKQFRDNPFKDWCAKLCIRQCFASVKHPQANGLVKRTNKSLGEGTKARLDERSKNWLEEISHVLWAHRTVIKSSNGETPFSLTY